MDILGFVRHLAAVELLVNAAARKGLERAAEVVEAEAKESLGTYQDQAGPFEDWAPLSGITISERKRLGYTPNDPLLRSGALRDSIGHSVSGRTATVGSTAHYAAAQELGTPDIPPRSFLGSATVRKSEEVRDILGEHLVAAIVGESISGARRFKIGG